MSRVRSILIFTKKKCNKMLLPSNTKQQSKWSEIPIHIDIAYNTNLKVVSTSKITHFSKMSAYHIIIMAKNSSHSYKHFHILTYLSFTTTLIYFCYYYFHLFKEIATQGRRLPVQASEVYSLA